MRWRPWPPLVTKKYDVRLVVRRLEGCCNDLVREGSGELGKLTVEIKWKGPKMALSSLRRPAVKRNFTREVDASLVQNGVVDWDEEFQSVCSFSAYKDNVFHPWEITFTVLNVSFCFFFWVLWGGFKIWLKYWWVFIFLQRMLMFPYGVLIRQKKRDLGNFYLFLWFDNFERSTNVSNKFVIFSPFGLFIL